MHFAREVGKFTLMLTIDLRYSQCPIGLSVSHNNIATSIRFGHEDAETLVSALASRDEANVIIYDNSHSIGMVIVTTEEERQGIAATMREGIEAYAAICELMSKGETKQ